MDILAKLFCKQSQMSKDPLLSRTVVVQSHSLGQWLKLRLAEQQGIAANIECILPATYIWRSYQTLLPRIDLPNASPFDRERLTWRLMRVIPRLKQEVLQRYLKVPGDKDIRLFQLSRQIAGLYDQYLIYRPDWLIEWERNEPASISKISPENYWQVELWRELIKDCGELANTHRARLHAFFTQAIEHNQITNSEFSSPLSIFGISSMAPLHLETFRNLSKIIDIDVYFLNPCEHYWGDILAPKELAKRSVRELSRDQSSLSDEDHLTIGNPLLGSLGKEGREYLDLLLGLQNTGTHELFVENSNDSMLGFIKNDILKLEYGGAFDYKPAPRALSDSDKSIQVHSAHGRMREVEILKDNLLGIFSEHDSINPRDVVVMAPDINEYAPYIRAVFDENIRYGIAGRSNYDDSRLISGFLKILALPSSRLTNIEVIDLLEIPSVSRRFNLNEDALKKVIKWIRDTEIRWEYNGEEKLSRWGLPAENFNTWQFGIDRLMLGYAIETGLYANNLAHPINESDSEVLGSFCHFINSIAESRRTLSKRHSASVWGDVLRNTLSKFFLAEDQEVLELEELHSALEEIVSDSVASNFSGCFTNRVIIDWFEQRLSEARQGPGVVRGGITFATLISMKSIPFKIVCLIGLNDSDFPRKQKPLSFDLMQITDTRKGDRSRRSEDRYLFLEAILSAQETLYLSFKGKSSRDDQERPPSSVLSELLDYINNIFPEFETTQHPLQPFSRKYYDGSLVSYQQVWFDALNRNIKPSSFIDKPLEIVQEARAVDMNQLIAFFAHPAKYFFNNRLDVFLGNEEIQLEESESFELSNLERYQLKNLALQSMIKGRDEKHLRKELAASGRVLNNSHGAKVLDQEIEVARSVYNELATSISKEGPISISEEISLEDRMLSFSISNIYGDQHIDIRPSKLQKRQLLGIWVKHLCLCSIGQGLETKTISFDKERTQISVFDAISASEAKSTLHKLTSIHDQGTCYPVHFFPQYSYDFIEDVRKGMSHLDALNKIAAIWRTGRSGSEADDAYWKRISYSSQLFDESFTQISHEIYSPLLKAWRKI